jgi:hypothetical protein
MLDAFKTNGNSPPRNYRTSKVLSSIAREDLSNPANLSWSFAVVDLLSALEERAFPGDARDAGKILEIEFHDCLIVGNSNYSIYFHLVTLHFAVNVRVPRQHEPTLRYTTQNILPWFPRPWCLRWHHNTATLDEFPPVPELGRRPDGT